MDAQWKKAGTRKNHRAYSHGLKVPPKSGRFTWCDFWKDAQLPEMWKERPVVIISYRNTLYGSCLVAPLSSKAQTDNPWAYRVSAELFTPGVFSWVICNSLSTVATSRLLAAHSAIPVISKTDFNQVIELIRRYLPVSFQIES